MSSKFMTSSRVVPLLLAILFAAWIGISIYAMAIVSEVTNRLLECKGMSPPPMIAALTGAVFVCVTAIWAVASRKSGRIGMALVLFIVFALFLKGYSGYVSYRAASQVPDWRKKCAS